MIVGELPVLVSVFFSFIEEVLNVVKEVIV
jgi:hypothetical protein